MESTWNPYIIYIYTVLLEQDHEQYKEDGIYVGISVRSFGAIFGR